MGVADQRSLVTEYRARWKDFDKVAALIAGHLRRACSRTGLLYADVAHRAKDPLSLAKKLVVKSGYTTLSAIPDLAGARVTVAGLHDRDAADEMIMRMFPGCERDDKTPSAPDRFTYLGVHYDTRLSDIQLSRASANLRDIRCEVQLHTRVQGAWAMITHDSVYKPTAAPTNEQLRHFNRLAALLEVFDHEAERGLNEMRTAADLAMAQLVEVLQAQFFHLTNTVGNPELSLFLVPLLVDSLYDLADQPNVALLVDQFVQARGREVTVTVRRYLGDARHPIMSQPELLVVWERLQTDPYRVLAHWPASIHTSFLKETAPALGIALPEV